MQCVVLADKCFLEPEGTLVVHTGYVCRQAEEVVCVNVVVLARATTLVGLQVGHQLVL